MFFQLLLSSFNCYRILHINFGIDIVSLPICVTMGLPRRAGACSRRNKGFTPTKRREMNPRPTEIRNIRGDLFARGHSMNAPTTL